MSADEKRDPPDWPATAFWFGAWSAFIVWLLIDNGVLR